MRNSFLPEDLLVFIQVRLPIKSLLRFKCVSKSWNVLISSPEFAKLHLQYGSSSIHKIANRLSYKDVYNKPEGLHSCLIHMAEFSITPGENLEIGCEFQRLYHPFESPGLEMDLEIVGSCNGLLCQILCSKPIYGDVYGHVYGDEYNISLCNPMTKSSWVLPKRSLFRNNESVVCYGLGYDDVHDEYKVMITCTASYRPHYECEVYSLTSNTWSIVRSDLDFFGLEEKKDGVLVNSALHWIMRDIPPAGAFWIIRDTRPPLRADEKNYVIAFDLRTDKHKHLSLPKVLEKFEQRLELRVLNGCLLVYESTISSLYLRPDDSFDLWMMKDYGLEDSWTRIRIRNSPYDLCELVPVALLEDSHHERKLVYFLYDNHVSMIFVYDIVSHQVLTFPVSVSGGWLITERLEFVGSLVQPHPPNIETVKSTFRGSPKKKKKKKKKKRRRGRKRKV